MIGWENIDCQVNDEMQKILGFLMTLIEHNIAQILQMYYP